MSDFPPILPLPIEIIVSTGILLFNHIMPTQSSTSPLTQSSSSSLLQSNHIHFDALPSEIIVLVISFIMNPRDFYALSLTCHRFALICRSNSLITLMKSRFITKAWLSENRNILDIVTENGIGSDDLVIKRFTNYSMILDSVYSIRNGKPHGHIIKYWANHKSNKSYCSRYGGSRCDIWSGCGGYDKYSLDIRNNNRILTSSKYKEGVPHGWWQFNEPNTTKYEILYENGVPLAYTNQYVSINIVDGKVNLTFERKYYNRVEHFIICQNKIVDMFIKLGTFFEYHDAPDAQLHGTSLLNLKLWLGNHRIVPIKVDLNHEPHIIFVPPKLENRRELEHIERISKIDRTKGGWKELSETK